jgi:uncharacterized SAM-binding protein YcdF (DUF218 family)
MKTLIDPIIFTLISIAIGFAVSFKNGRKQAVRIVLTATFLFLYIISISPASNALCYILEKDYFLKNNDNVDKLDIVVVLGGGVSDNKYLQVTIPSNQTASRLLYAIQVFKKSGARYLVCSGEGTGRLSEAEVMKRASIRLGIPDESIKIDSMSKNTWEHARELNDMFQDKNIRIGLVTSAYHMKRSEREFNKYFSNIIPMPSGYLYSSSELSVISFIPKSGNLNRFSTALHEIIGIVWYRIKG